jgi:hypothetical protein
MNGSVVMAVRKLPNGRYLEASTRAFKARVGSKTAVAVVRLPPGPSAGGARPPAVGGGLLSAPHRRDPRDGRDQPRGEFMGLRHGGNVEGAKDDLPTLSCAR